MLCEGSDTVGRSDAMGRSNTIERSNAVGRSDSIGRLGTMERSYARYGEVRCCWGARSCRVYSYNEVWDLLQEATAEARGGSFAINLEPRG